MFQTYKNIDVYIWVTLYLPIYRYVVKHVGDADLYVTYRRDIHDDHVQFDQLFSAKGMCFNIGLDLFHNNAPSYVSKILQLDVSIEQVVVVEISDASSDSDEGTVSVLWAS